MIRYALIVAGGKGKRMNSATPKQFMLLSGKPILYYSIKAFSESYKDIKIIVVLPKEYFYKWRELCRKYKINISHQLAPGGETRFQSVKNGLKLTDPDKEGLIAVHDAARPLVSVKLIKKLFKLTEKESKVIPVIKLSDSLRELKGKTSFASDRNNYRSVQTPQCFTIDLLKKAYKLLYKKIYTDDATVVESMGEKIYLAEGERNNIKITLPADIALAEALLKN